MKVYDKRFKKGQEKIKELNERQQKHKRKKFKFKFMAKLYFFYRNKRFIESKHPVKFKKFFVEMVK